MNTPAPTHKAPAPALWSTNCGMRAITGAAPFRPPQRRAWQRRCWTDCPSETVFGDQPAFQKVTEAEFAEASRLCFGRPARRDAFYRVVAHLAALAVLHGAEWVVACPREEHNGIYQRRFGFQQLAEPREYFGVNCKTSLLAIPREELRRRAEAFKSIRGAWEEAMLSAAATV